MDTNVRNIPNLLFKEIGFQKFSSFENKQYMGIEIVNSKRCAHFFISEKTKDLKKNTIFHLWIEPDTLKIIKIRRITTKSEIDYNYTLVEMPEDDIEFTPPPLCQYKNSLNL